MIILFILIYLVSLIIHLVVCYKENKRHIFLNHTIRAGYTSKLVSKCGIIPIDLNSEFRPKSQTQVDVLDSYVNSFLHSKSNEYVVFDGTSKELFCGSLKRCVAWLNENKEHYSIYSREAYNEMLNKINEVTLHI